MTKTLTSHILLLLLLLPTPFITAQEIFSDTVKLKPVTIRAQSGIKNMQMLKYQLDSLQITNSAQMDLSEMLRDNTAAFIKQTVQGSTAGLSLRGTNSSHTRVIWNNIPLNSPMHGSTDISTLPFWFADNVSILYSAASIPHSDGALGGCLYLENKPVWNNGFSLHYAGTAGSFKSYGNFLKLNFSTKKLSTSTRLYHAGAKNNFTYQNNSIIDGGEMIRENADFKNSGIMQSISWRPAENNFISLHAWAQSGERGVPGLITNESGEQNQISRQHHQELRSIVKYTHQGKQIKLKAWSAFNMKNDHFTTDNYISGLGQYRSIDSYSMFKSFYQGILTGFNIRDKHTIETSLKYNVNLANTTDKNNDNTQQFSRNDIHITAEYEYALDPDVRIVILMKEDIIDKQAYTPNYGATYSHKIHDKLNLLIGVSRNMHHPSLNDMYYIPGGNPELQPEIAYTTDGALRFTMENGCHIDNKLNVYYRQIEDYIIWRPGPQGFWEADNISEVESAGCEYNLSARKKIKKITITAHASYALNRSVNKTSAEHSLFNQGGQLPYIPVHAINISPAVSWRKWQVKYQWNFYSERYTTSSNATDVLYSMYPYFMNNLHLSKTFSLKNSNIRVKFSVFNLFNESYRSVLWQPMPGIHFRGGIQFQFK